MAAWSNSCLGQVMSRTSRIPHPPGTRYVPIHVWACMRFGLAGAAIIGLLEFYDRAEPTGGLPVASRIDIVADLQGIVGKHVIDAALRELEQSGAIQRHVRTEPGNSNIKRTVTYGLDLPGLASLLATPGFGNSRNSQSRESPKLPKPGPKSGVPSNVCIEKEAAAPRAYARGTADAAASDHEAKRRHPRRTVNGIECWYASDDVPADAIEASANPEQIAAAVAAIKLQLNGAGRKTSPVPALVLAELERQQRERDAAVRLAQADAELRIRAKSEIDPMAQNKGLQLLAKTKGQQLFAATLRSKLPQTTTKEAAA